MPGTQGPHEYQAEPIDETVKRSLFEKYQACLFTEQELYRRQLSNPRLKPAYWDGNIGVSNNFKAAVNTLDRELHAHVLVARKDVTTVDELKKAHVKMTSPRLFTVKVADDYLENAGVFLREIGVLNIDVKKKATDVAANLASSR